MGFWRRPGPEPGRFLVSPTVPLWLKIAYTVFMAVWIPVYWRSYGPTNFLWICDVANFVILVALWLDSALLLASQAVAVLIIQALWLLDVLVRLFFGVHPVGGTEYMFDPAKPPALRALSLFHVLVPALLLWLVRRLGYDRRAWKLQTLFLWILLPLTFWLADAESNVNWLWRPFGIEPPLLPSPWVLPAAMIAMPLVLYLPTHAALLAWAGRQSGSLQGIAPRRRSSSISASE